MNNTRTSSVKPQESIGNSKYDCLNTIEEIEEILTNIETRLPIEIEATVSPKTFVVTKDMSSIIVGSKKGNLMIYNASTGELERENDKSNSAIASIALSPNESMILLVDKEGMLCLLSYPSLSPISCAKLSVSSSPIVKAISDDSFIISGCSAEETPSFILYNLVYNGNIKLQPLLTVDGQVNCLEVFSGIFIGLNSGKVENFNLENQSRKTIFQHDLPVDHLSLSHTKNYVAIGLGNSDDDNPESFSVVILNYDNMPFRHLKSHSSKITGLEFLEKDEYLISSSKDANILLWKILEEHKVMNFLMYNSPVTCIRSVDDKLFAAQKTNIITIWDIPSIPKRAKLMNHQHDIIQIKFFSKKQAITIDTQGLLVVWDLETESVSRKYNFNRKIYGFGLSKDNSFCLVATAEPCLYKLNLKDMSTAVINSERHFDCFAFSSHGESVLTGDSKNRLIEWQMPDFKDNWTMKGHLKPINCIKVLSSLNRALSGSKDCTINYWDLSTHTLLGRFIGHTAPVTSVKASKNTEVAFSSSLDSTIKIWGISSYRLIYSLQSDLPILSLKIVASERYMITGDENSITYWDLRMHTKILNYPSPEKISTLSRSNQTGNIGLAIKNGFFIINDPFVNGRFEILGKDLDYQYMFMKYVYNMIHKTNEFLTYREEFNTLVFAPYLLNILHCIALVNDNYLLKSCLKSEKNVPGLFHSQAGSNALNLSIEHQFIKCTDTLLQYMSHESANNKKLLYPLNDSLSKLNSMNLKYLPELYNSLVKKSKAVYLPKIVSASIKLPLYHLNTNTTVLKESFNIPDRCSTENKNVMFKSSMIKICLLPGAAESVNFLKSLKDAPQSNILSSELVEHILRYKWKKLRFFIYCEALLYVLYLFFLFMHSYFPNETYVFMSLGIMQLVLTVVEFFNLLVERLEFFASFWNSVDLVRIILCFLYLYMYFTDEDKDTKGEVIYVLVVFVSGFRGLSYFRIFKATRYMINLILEVFKDIMAFFALFFYATLLFGLIMILMPVYPFTPSFEMTYIEGFSIDIGYSDTDHFEIIDWVFFSFANIVCPITMLNLMIAIMSDTYERVQDTSVVADRLELIDMILELEQLFRWNQKKNQRNYIQICAAEENNKDADQEWKGKVREIKKMFQDSQKKIQVHHSEVKEMYSKLNDVVTSNKRNIEDIKNMIRKQFEHNDAESERSLLRSDKN